jgi:hypothetical protein
VDEACTQAAGAHREANRLQRMAGRKLVSEDALDVALTRAKAADASCAAARANVNVAHESSAVVTEQIEKTRLRAPFAGVVAELNAKLGEFITPSPTGIPTLPAVDLIDMSCLYVSAPIDEVDAPQIKTGMPACVSLDAFPDKRCNAEVRRIAPYVLDARRCISYLTIELEGSIPEDLRPLIGNRVYGCDDCQLFCPWNRYAKLTALPDFAPRHGLERASLLTLFDWDEDTFLANTEGSAIRRISFEQWQRNLAVALGNAPPDAATIVALRARRPDVSPLVQEHIDWALTRLGASA